MAWIYSDFYPLILLVKLLICCRTIEALSCPLIFESGRQECGYPGINKYDCESEGCCWDENAQDTFVRCHRRECKPGYFGWGCRFQCHCEQDPEGGTCDPVTGECPVGCPKTSWGVGCMLDNECTYNDPGGSKYMGKQIRTSNGHICGSWSLQKAYPSSHFVDKDIVKAENYCRNPEPRDYRTWCYYAFARHKKWDYCILKQCPCPTGRFGVNCEDECHCSDAQEACHPMNGTCTSGCNPRFQGPNCQECAQGYFGKLCEHECHCKLSSDVCNKRTGNCKSGCSAGWTGANCQTECADGYYGPKCGFQCNCKNNTEVCSKETGKCLSGCKAGFSGAGCQIQCRCRDPKESCNSMDGSCRSGCAPGWAGAACHIEIPMMTRPPLKDTRSATSILLKWRRWRKPVDGGDGPVEGYIVYYRELGEEQWHSLRTDDTRVTLKDLTQDTFYTVKVSPIHKEGIEGFPSPELNISTCGTPTAGPRDLRVRVGSLNSNEREEEKTEDEIEDEEVDTNINRYVKLVVQWKAPLIENWGCDRLLKYKIYTRGIGTGQYSFLRDSDIHRIEIPDIDAFHNYSIGVSVMNSASIESEMVTDTFIGRSGPVRHLAVVAMSPTSLGVSWSPPEHVLIPIQTYVIRYKELRISDCDVETSAWSEKILLPGHQQEYILSALRAYTRYQVRIWAESAAGKGQTETTLGTTMAQAPLVSVTSLVRTMLKPNYASFKWDPIECEKRMGDTVGYKYKVLNLQTGESFMHMVNETQVTVYSLIPYTNYSFTLQYINHIGEGPSSEASAFTTLQGRPPPPQDVKVTPTGSNTLTVEWAPPDPPHGILTGYEVQYWCAHNLAQPTVVRNIRQTLHQYVIKGLNATTGYGVQVRAYTPIGYGDWSAVLYGFTEEARPDQPQSFTNISRSSDSLTLSWSDPRKANGQLENYQLQCSPITPKSGKSTDDIYEELPATVHNYTIQRLQPGTQYVCTLRASTRKGYGEDVKRIFWTLPSDPASPKIPKIVDKKSTDTSLMVLLDLPQEIHTTDISRSKYQIVVEKLVKSPRAEEQRLRRSAGTPCGLPPELLTSYHKAKKQNLNCYIAAEFDSMDSQFEEFVVGDNKTYGGYYNAPLETGQTYDVWYGVINIVDGETAATYTKTGEPGRVGEQVDPGSKANNTMMVAGAGVAALITVILVIIIVAVIISKRRSQKKLKGQHDLILPVKPPLEESLENNERPTRPPRRFELEQQPNNLNGINIIDNTLSNTLTKLHGVPLPDESDSSDSETDNPYSNSAIDIDLKPISVENLWNYIKEKKASRTEGFRYEYDMLPHGLKAKCEVARKPENKFRNRYGNIVAYDHSRVKLVCLPDDPHSDYINADYIDGYKRPQAFIATQGPTRHTLNDIWRMAWQQNSHRIIMVTNLVEDGRKSRRKQTDSSSDETEHKCEQYWPDSGSRPYGDITVELRDTEKLADFTIRSFVLTKGSERKQLWQFHFTAWPDHGVPSYATSLLAFRKKVRSYDDVTAGPAIVHCSAGVGRTGAFIAIDSLLEMAKAEGKIDVFRWVQNMRKNRVNMVQTLEQYVFVYDAIFEALKCGDTSIPCVNFRRKYSDLCKLNPETDRPRLLEEYELLGVMSPSPNQSTCRDAVDPENNHKNRFKDIIPMDNLTRPYLVTYIPGATDYINAIFSDGYKQKDAFIVTQHPLPHTTTDFWTMCYDHRCKTIVMMNEIDMKDETCQRYWPDEVGGSMSCGPFRVELLSKDTSQLDIVVRDFAITLSIKNTEPHYIRHFQYRGWPRYVPVPPLKPSLLRLLGLVEKWQQRSGNATIVVHCLNGAHQSGLFCTVSYMLEMLKVEQEVDVFQSTKHVRITRPQFIPTLDQYNFLYEIAIEYMDSFDAYANFK